MCKQQSVSSAPLDTQTAASAVTEFIAKPAVHEGKTVTSPVLAKPAGDQRKSPSTNTFHTIVGPTGPVGYKHKPATLSATNVCGDNPKALTSPAPTKPSVADKHIQSTVADSCHSGSPIVLEPASDVESEVDVEPVNALLRKATQLSHTCGDSDETDHIEENQAEPTPEESLPISPEGYYRIVSEEVTQESVNNKIVLCWVSRNLLGVSHTSPQCEWFPAIIREIVSTLE